MYIFLFLFSFAWADVSIRSLAETTYTRDNTYCQLGNKKVEIQIRSEASHTEPKEKNYGEYIFIYPRTKPKLLPINQDKLNTFRLFLGRNTLCTKSYGYALAKDKVAVLFLKENRPFMDKLAIQVVNPETLKGEEVIETDFRSDKTEKIEGGFLFRTYEERNGLEMGKVKLQDVEYTFQDRDFSYWMKYTLKGFEISGPVSYQYFQWKNYFKDEKDFFTASGWNDTEKKFSNSVLYVAVNHKIKKECILLSPTKLKISGSELGWRCNQSL